MDMFGFGNLFGFEELGATEETPKKENKKPEKKQDVKMTAELSEEDDMDEDEELMEEETESSKEKPKKSTKTSSKKKIADGDTEVQLPIKVLASTFSCDIQELGTRKLSEVFDMLFELGYVEVACKRSCVLDKEHAVLYLLDRVTEADEKASVSISAEHPVTVGTGLQQDIITMQDFLEMSPEEIGVEDVAEIFESHSPSYKGSSYAYDAGKNVMVPVVSAFRKLRENAEFPCTYFMYGIMHGADDICKDGKDVLTALSACFDINEACVDLSFVTDAGGRVHPVFEAAKGAAVLTLSKTAATKPVAKKELYTLPLTCWLANAGIELELTSEMFGGRSKIDKEDVREVLGQEYIIFRKTEKQMDCQYIKAANRLAVNVSSSTKGAGAAMAGNGFSGSIRKVVNRETLVSLLKNGTQGCYYCAEAGFAPLRLENTSIGSFIAEVDSLRNLSHLRFKSRLPKVPYGLLQTIIADFKRDLTREAVVQIYWNTKTRSFYLVRPQIEDVSKCHVTFLNKFRGKENVLFMTVHSHNTMPAVFSAIDNGDECYTGLFGVIGTLDEEPSMCFRAGMEGTFCNLEMGTIFEE